jgi:tartrate dehydratase beta subunit/fumarate hydratase class I family protein
MKRADLLLGCVVFLYGALPVFSGTVNAAPRAMASRAVEAYSGTIVSLNGELYVLRDEDSGSWYHLDDQRNASKYAGKRVLVVGRLDTHTDVIHVELIEEAK